ncbi:MAG: hypothetical protein Q8L64_05395 [bacterium]|nr:hypothetical protein [bacterium]
MHIYIGLSSSQVFSVVLGLILLVAAIVLAVINLKQIAANGKKPRVTIKVHTRLAHSNYNDLPCDVFIVQTRPVGANGELVREAIERSGYAFPKELITEWLTSHASLLPKDATILVELKPPQGDQKAVVTEIITDIAGRPYHVGTMDCFPSADRVFYAVVATEDVADTIPYRSKNKLVPHRA